MEPSRELSRKAFVAAVLFESSLAGFALVMGLVTGVAVLGTFTFDLVDAGLGVALTLPPVAFLFLFVNTQWAPLRRIRDALDTSFVPMFRHCSWDELLALALTAGVGEELLFRGWLQAWLDPTAGPWISLIVTSIAFGLVHAVTPAYAVLATFIGLYLGGIQMATDNLLVAILVHALYDFVAFKVLLSRAPPTGAAPPPPPGTSPSRSRARARSRRPPATRAKTSPSDGAPDTPGWRSLHAASSTSHPSTATRARRTQGGRVVGAGVIDSLPMASHGSERTVAGRDAASGGSVGAGSALGSPAVLFAGFTLLGLVLYRAALSAPFVSDDFGYLVTHPYTAPLTFDNVLAILDPWGPAKLYAANYAPVHLLLTAIERHIFADALLGYHLVNVLLHALNCVLVVWLLRQAGIPELAAAIGGLLFAVHPANVEVVAWSSQLKTLLSFAFGYGALLALRRSPPLAAALFALSLLSKAAGLFALPTAALLVWMRRGDAGGRRSDALWLAVWVGIAVLYAIPQFASFAHLGAVEVEAFRDPWVQLRTIAAVGARYLLMAATGIGVSAFQEPEPATSWLDPYWLAALPAGALLGWRFVHCVRRRRVEAVFWMAAAASFAPVSQLFPFLHPVADRYLYFVLPGLIGGAWLWGRERLDSPSQEGGGRLRLAVLAAVVVSCAAFAVQSASRAALWRSETLLLLDAAKHYPDGGTAHFLRARSAAQQGDVERAVASLRFATERGLDNFGALDRDPGLAPIRNDPAFRALVREVAGRWIERARSRGYSTQAELRMLALAHVEREEWADAVAAYEAALAAGGPLEPEVRVELAQARARLAAQESRAGGGAVGR